MHYKIMIIVTSPDVMNTTTVSHTLSIIKSNVDEDFESDYIEGKNCQFPFVLLFLLLKRKKIFRK